MQGAGHPAHASGPLHPRPSPVDGVLPPRPPPSSAASAHTPCPPPQPGPAAGPAVGPQPHQKSGRCSGSSAQQRCSSAPQPGPAERGTRWAGARAGREGRALSAGSARAAAAAGSARQLVATAPSSSWARPDETGPAAAAVLQAHPAPRPRAPRRCPAAAGAPPRLPARWHDGGRRSGRWAGLALWPAGAAAQLNGGSTQAQHWRQRRRERRQAGRAGGWGRARAPLCTRARMALKSAPS